MSELSNASFQGDWLSRETVRGMAELWGILDSEAWERIARFHGLVHPDGQVMSPTTYRSIRRALEQARREWEQRGPDLDQLAKELAMLHPNDDNSEES